MTNEDDDRRTELPDALRGGWFEFDRRLAAALAVSTLLQVGFVAWLEIRDWPTYPIQTDEIEDVFAGVEARERAGMEVERKPRKTDETTAPDPSRTDREASDDQPDDEPERDDASDPAREPTGDDDGAAPDSESPARERQVADPMEETVVAALGAASDEEGPIADALARGVDESAMDDAFEGSTAVASGSSAETGIETSGSSQADASGETRSIGGLDPTRGAREAQREVETGDREEQTVRVDLQEPPETVGDGELKPGSVSALFRRFRSRIRGCYERRLKRDPDLAGKVVVTFTIRPDGRVAPSTASTDTVGDGVGSCVASVVRRLPFPKPTGGSVTLNKAFVFAPGR